MSAQTDALAAQANAIKKQKVMVGTFQIDVTVTESHSYESQVTEFPVEKGSAITDNIRPKPITVTLEGVVSDTPIGSIADLRNSQGDNGQMDFLPSVDALAALLAIRDARQPVPISTSLKSYENMAMATLSIPRDAETGAALRFSATFQQITLVTNQRTTVRVQARTSSPTGAAKKNKGKWATVAGVEVVYVVTSPVSQRPYFVPLRGNPITTDSFGDHYKVPTGGATVPDGYIDSQNAYHVIDASAASVGQSAFSNTSGQTINGKPVHYDQASNAWVDSSGQAVNKQPPAGMSSWTPPSPNKPPGF